MPKGALKFKNMTVNKQQGELARFRVLGGPDSGSVFVITNARSTIGRAEDNDVILGDIKASRKHAELSVVGGVATIKDIGSSHGFVVNGVQSKEAQLKSGDKVGLGGTVLEFIGSTDYGATQMIVRPPVQSAKIIGTINSQSGLTQFIARPQPSAEEAGKAAKPQKPQGFLEKNKKLVIMLMLMMAVTGGVQQVDNARRKPNKYLPPKDSGAQEPDVLKKEDFTNPAFKQADIYFNIGKRELRSENWLRAETAFQTAVEIYNGHKLAKVYLGIAKEKKKEKAIEFLNLAQKEADASRFKMAIAHADAARRMYESDQASAKIMEKDKRTNEDHQRDLYKEATDKIDDLKKKIEQQEVE